MATSLAPDMVRAVESRAEVDSLGDLQERRRVLIQQLAPLSALYGNFGMWDARRKQLLDAIQIRVRMLAEKEGTKVTDKLVDAAAHADEQYERFLDDSYQSKIEYIVLENELSDITERISSREAELYVYGKEASLAR